MILGAFLLEDDVNVATDQLTDFLAVRRLHRVVALLIVAEILKIFKFLLSLYKSRNFVNFARFQFCIQANYPL